MNKFKVGDKIKCSDLFEYGPKIGEEFVITCINENKIGFISQYPIIQMKFYKNERKGKKPCWDYDSFELAQSAEDIDFDNRIKEITDESV